MKFLPASVCALLLAATGAAEAAPQRSISHSDWQIAMDRVTVKVFLPADELTDLVGKAFPMLSAENLAKYVLAHLAVASNGAACPAIDQGYDIGQANSLSSGAQLYAYELIFRCNTSGRLLLTNTLLQSEHGAHIDYARIERGQESVSQLFTRSQPSLTLEASPPLLGASASAYAKLGAGHIFSSYAALLVLLACTVLLPRRPWAAGGTMAAGYVLATLLGVTRWMPEPAGAQAALGFVLMFCAVLLVYPSIRRPQAAMAVAGLLWLSLLAAAWLAHKSTLTVLIFGLGLMLAGGLRGIGLGQRWPRKIPPALFGFVDGLVLSKDFVRLQQFDELSVRRVLAFNGGALLADLLVVAALTVAIGLARRSRLLPSAPLLKETATTVFAGFGSFWLLSPLF